MELRHYWDVIARRWWAVVGVFLVALAASVVGLTIVPPTSIYQATIRLSIHPNLEPRGGIYYMYDGYYAFLASEYLNDDLIEVIRSGSFLRLIQEQARGEIGRAPGGSVDAKKAHRVVTLTASSSTPDDALHLVRAAGTVLADTSGPDGGVLGRLSARSASIVVVDPPTPAGGGSQRALADLAMRALLGVIAGLALAFLLDYLDDSLRSPAEVEEVLGVPVLGAIPRVGATRRRTRSGETSTDRHRHEVLTVEPPDATLAAGSGAPG
ncbi:MAG: hypothetical protein HYY04_16360 [Chloroflexi bacterium]|nr:hypothetical protein [Chloroflexota bacterium]